jgi:hypothetical protein
MRTAKILLLLAACFSAGVVSADVFGPWIEPPMPASQQNSGFADTPGPSSPSRTQFVVYPATHMEI